MENYKTKQMTPEMQRLMRYAINFGKDGAWLVNQEDCIPSLETLEDMELIERNEAGDRWRLPD